MLEVLYILYMLSSNIEYPAKEIECMAQNLYHEARGEPVEGQIAVGNVVLNRVLNPRYPDNICSVVRQAQYDPITSRLILHGCQFSWYCDGKSDRIENKKVYLKIKLLSAIIIYKLVEDNTNGATHYFNPNLADPYWAKEFIKVKEYSNHDFYRGE